MSLLRIPKGVNNLSLARCPNFIQRSKAKINVKYEIDLIEEIDRISDWQVCQYKRL